MAYNVLRRDWFCLNVLRNDKSLKILGKIMDPPKKNSSEKLLKCIILTILGKLAKKLGQK